MNLITVLKDRCKKDGICAAECPTRIIEMDPLGGYPRSTPDAESYCLSCGHCVAVCPQEAISLSWLSPHDCTPIREGLRISTQAAEQFLRARRSIRSFKKKPLSRDTLNELIRVACFAPSAKNKQPWHWLVLEDREKVRQAAALVIEWMKKTIAANPELAETMGFIRVTAAWEKGDERICRDAPHVIIVHGDASWPFGCEDCTLALSYLDLYAQSQGLGTCWAGYLYTAVNHYKPLFKWLEIPPEHRAYGAMMVGRPLYSYKRLPLRATPVVKWF